MTMGGGRRGTGVEEEEESKEKERVNVGGVETSQSGGGGEMAREGRKSGRSWRKTTRKVEGGQVMQQFTLASTVEHNRTASRQQR